MTLFDYKFIRQEKLYIYYNNGETLEYRNHFFYFYFPVV